MRFFCLVLVSICLPVTIGLAQQPISISQSDMPTGGDTFRMSTALNTGSFPIQKKGANKIWDFSNIQTDTNQYVDSYRSMNDLPSVYGILGFLKGANFAKEEGQLPGGNLPFNDGGFSLEDLFTFYEKNSQAFTKVAYGISLSSLDVPAPFDQNDVVYRFPVNYGDKDSSVSFFSFPPGNFQFPDSTDLYFERRHKRVNDVSGWGTIKTPYGTFDALKVKTTHYYDDSVYLQGIGQNIPERKEVKYKWLAKNMGTPLLTAHAQVLNGNEIITRITYQDSLRKNNSESVDTGKSGRYLGRLDKGNMVYPNPTNGIVNVRLNGIDQTPLQLYVFDSKGEKVYSKKAENNDSKSPIKVNLSHLQNGHYFFLIRNSEKIIDYRQIVLH